MTEGAVRVVVVLAVLGAFLTWHLVGVIRHYLRCRDLRAQMRVLDRLLKPEESLGTMKDGEAP
ncbi:hypothetical protein [Asaia astilbis]|uniref:hypothetical protein n=1 Tax=Asaia astilbis TaxID=610244 RepID=UPI000472DC4B|nr:hypothetical protein [Asaia astilbis]